MAQCFGLMSLSKSMEPIKLTWEVVIGFRITKLKVNSGCFNKYKERKKRVKSHLFPPRLPVNGALVELVVLAAGGVDGVDVDDGHLLIQHLGPALHQFACLAV